MSAAKAKAPVNQGDQIFTKISMLIFLGVLLMGLGAERPLWPSLYRAFFVWLTVSLLAGGLRVLWKYHLYREREHELESNLQRAREEESRLIQERRQRKEQMNDLINVMQTAAENEAVQAPAQLESQQAS
jgi:sensor c-di-GMP phosphodiesterase-like protein